MKLFLILMFVINILGSQKTMLRKEIKRVSLNLSNFNAT